MEIFIKSKMLFESLSDMDNIKNESIDMDWTQCLNICDECANEFENWDELQIAFGFKKEDIWINIIPEIEELILSIKKQYNLPKEIVLSPYFWIEYKPKVEKGYDELEMRLWFKFDEVLNEVYLNSLNQNEKSELEENIDNLHDETFYVLRFDKEHDKNTENMRRFINLFYFQINNMTVYEKLLEEPILNSEVNHEESVKRTTARLKRLHRQTLDYFRNPVSVFQNNFLN